MNERIVSIAQKLANADCSLSLDELAHAHGVSSRTIRNDLKTLNRFLSERNFDQLDYGPGGSIVVPADFSRVTAFLPIQDFYSYKMSSDERKNLAAVILAEDSGYVTLADIANQFSVSRATILNDLDGIKAIVHDAELTVISKPSYGLMVVGDEKARRRFLLEFSLSDSPLAEQWALALERKAVQADAMTITKILNEQSRLHFAVLDDHSFRIVRNYLCISVKRCRGGQQIEKDNSQIETGHLVSQCFETYSYAKDVIKLIAQYCSVNMGDGEVENFARILESSGYRSDSEFSIEDVQVQTVTRKFVKNVSLACGVDLNGDYALFECLSNHLESMFSSDASRFPVNPSLREVVTDQPQILDAVKDNLSIIESYSKRRITEVETIYVALHICAALERRKNMERKLRVILVCDEGVGTSQLTVEELRGRFGIKVIKAIPAHEIAYLDSYSADLVISTVPLKDCPIESVAATLPFTDRDYVRIRAKINEVRSLGGGTTEAYDELGAQGLLDRIEPLLRSELSDGGEQLIRQVRTEVRRYFHETQHMEEEILTPYLHQLLPAEHIQLDVSATDWRDAIAKSAQPLIERGFIEPCYIDAMIENVERNGPYIVLAPHFAIPHEAPERGTHKLSMSLVRLKESVCFGAGDHDPVEFVCTLAPTDHKTHLKAFFNLLSLLSKPELTVFEQLHEARTPDEIVLAIESAEYRLIQ